MIFGFAATMRWAACRRTSFQLRTGPGGGSLTAPGASVAEVDGAVRPLVAAGGAAGSGAGVGEVQAAINPRPVNPSRVHSALRVVELRVVEHGAVSVGSMQGTIDFLREFS